MCEFSLEAVKSRPAAVGDKLVTLRFSTGTCAFIDESTEDTAVCLLLGTEVAFEAPVTALGTSVTFPMTARFGKDVSDPDAVKHRDTLEFADGRELLLTLLRTGQRATVLQLPAKAKPEMAPEAKTDRALEVVE